MKLCARCFCLALALLPLWAGLAAAQERAQEAAPFGLSDFEWRMTQRAMARHALRPLATPDEAEGRVVEAIYIDTEDPLTPEDPWPDWGNLFHVTSRPEVIQRELLFAQGDRWQSALAQESARNLRARGPLVLSVALVLPMEGSSPDKVKVLVVTKDIWSLRTNTNFLFVGGTLNFLALSLSENNIAGRHKLGALTSLLEQDTLTLGEYYSDPRVWGSRVSLEESAAIILSRETGRPEGFTAGVTVGQPLYALRTPWGWSLGATGLRLIERRFEQDQLLMLSNPDTGESVPFVYRAQRWSASAAVTRSYGLRYKSNLTLGYLFTDGRFDFAASDAEAARFTQQTRDAFAANFLPRSELISQVSLSYEFFEADFEPLRNVESFALPEDFRFGPSLTLRAGHADPLLGSDARFESLSASALYRLALTGRERLDREGDIVSVSLSAETRLQGGEALDNEWILSLRNYSPVFWGGRLVWRGVWVRRTDDRSNRISALGGDAGLRGYESGVFLARSYGRSNLEWRTLPLELWTFQLGLVAFYDAAGFDPEGTDIFQGTRHAVGLGGRWLNPASNRVVLRFDWGFPLGAPEGTLPGSFAFGFEQAF
jgi:hypothetical protein